MGMIDEFETSLQVLRGFDTDISVEVYEIKVFSWLIIMAKIFHPNARQYAYMGCS